MALGFTTSAIAQQTLTVYDGDATSQYVPIYGFYADAYMKAECVMNSGDLMEMKGGTITGLRWYLSSPAADSWGDALFQIFIKEVNEPTISAYYGMNNATIVYEGQLDGTQNTMDIVFTTPYVYNGGHLLIGVYNIQTGNYKGASFYGKVVTSAAVNGTSYTSLDLVNCTQRDFLPKTTFTYTPGSGTFYNLPFNLQATDITPNSAVITWTPGADETSWNVEYKKHSEEVWVSAGSVTTPEIELDFLHNGTPYDVRVQADHGNGNLSNWAIFSFNTPGCEADDMGEVTFFLTDTYGDGWNRNKLQIVYHDSGLFIEEFTLPSSTSEGTFHANLCYGVDYDLVWVAGSYPFETGFTVTGPEGEVIYEFHGTGSSSGPVPTPGVLTTFHISRVTCPRPTDLTASDIVYNGATLTWTPGTVEQDLWEVVYGVGVFNPNEVLPVTVSEPKLQLTGLEENTTYSAYVRSVCTPEDMSIWSDVCIFTTPLHFPIPINLAVDNITAKSADATWNGPAETYNVRYRMKTLFNESFEAETAPLGWTLNDWQVMPISQYTMNGNPLYAADGNYCLSSKSMDVSGTSLVPLNVDNWLISLPVTLGGTLEFYAADLGADYVENFSVYVSLDGNTFVALSENISTPGVLNQWGKNELDLSAYQGQQGYIAFRHHDSQGYYLFIDAVSINGVPENEWTVMEGVTSPVAMKPLQPGTTYEVQVQGVHEDGISAWCNAVTFVTLSVDAIPTNLQVPEVTDKTATVTWIGAQDAYNLRYRKAAVTYSMSEDFTGVYGGGQPQGWTFIDADNDGFNWFIFGMILDDGSIRFTLSSESYVNNYGALTPDNWAITPNVKLGSYVQFDAWGQKPSNSAEVFRVYVSTTGTSVNDFIPISDDITTTGVQTTYTFDLSQYTGQNGYIAIRHYNVTNQFMINVANFYMAGEKEDEPEGEWIVVENVTSPYVIEGLDPETTYEVEVQGILERRNTTDWTNLVMFTTLGEQPTEKTQTPEAGYQEVPGYHGVIVTITSHEGDVYYRIIYTAPDGTVTEGDWTPYNDAFAVNEDGHYCIEFYAIADGKLPSDTEALEFTVGTITGLEEMTNGKTIANVRYFNALGQEMLEANGLTIIVTTYTDGTTSSVRVMK